MERAIRILTLSILAGVALYLLIFVHAFGQDRFFTKDEFQWGHLAWLVQQGQVPYLDFYEHHLPLGYLAHAPLVPREGAFADRALFLRKLEFGYLVAAVGMLAAATWVARRNPHAALLTAILCLGFGFGSMSAIEFRADNWAGFLFLIGLSLLEINRRLQARSVAIAAGILFALAVFVTQKILLLGGLALAAMLAVGAIPVLAARRDSDAPPLIVHPLAFCMAGVGVGLLGVVAAAAWGILPRAFEINFHEALAHEQLYPANIRVSRYAFPYLAETALTTLPILGLAALHLRRGLSGFWSLPLTMGLVGGLIVKAQYPYNYVVLGLCISVAAVRGFTDLVERYTPDAGVARAMAPLLYLAPLLLIPDQLGFLRDRTSNDHQLRLLEMVERHTTEEDVVIDDSGSALFRPHRGYYWYHDKAHVQLFSDYFEREFVDDLRRTRAVFWIRGSRVGQLPEAAQRYLERHYLPFFGSLHVLGFATQPAPQATDRIVEVEVLRGGRYYISSASGGVAAPRSRRGGLWLDGSQIEGESVPLEEGTHRLRVEPGSPGYAFTYLRPLPFGTNRGMNRVHDPGFEYSRR